MLIAMYATHIYRGGLEAPPASSVDGSHAVEKREQEKSHDRRTRLSGKQPDQYNNCDLVFSPGTPIARRPQTPQYKHANRVPARRPASTSNFNLPAPVRVWRRPQTLPSHYTTHDEHLSKSSFYLPTPKVWNAQNIKRTFTVSDRSHWSFSFISFFRTVLWIEYIFTHTHLFVVGLECTENQTHIDCTRKW
jgi:hypothetical protein